MVTSSFTAHCPLNPTLITSPGLHASTYVILATFTALLPPTRLGETVTLRCEIQGGGGTQWTYEWRPTNRNSPTSSEYRINRVSESDNGEYSCKAKRGRQLTDWSDAFRLTVRYKPRATLTADRTTIPLGGSVTLTCSVDKSVDWKFDWFRNGKQYSVGRIRGNTEPSGTISVSEGRVYSCRGGRGDPVFQTETSNEVSIQKTGEFSFYFMTVFDAI
uniref:Ig-like domain-containing protein n=1 Tax=Poecilia mexicana TaxID=48701 RepID=A0A3B3YWE3_9TELE